MELRYNKGAMNTKDINYPYMAGYLQSLLRGLACDYRFINAGSEDARLRIVEMKIDEARAMAETFETLRYPAPGTKI